MEQTVKSVGRPRGRRKTEYGPYHVGNDAWLTAITPAMAQRYGTNAAFVRASHGRLDAIRWGHIRHNNVRPDEAEVRVVADLLDLHADELCALLPKGFGKRCPRAFVTTKESPLSNAPQNKQAADTGDVSAAAA